MAELVDKQAALAEIDATIEGSLQRPEDVYIDKGLMMARTLIEKLSTIDAEPVRHGKWLVNSQYAINVCSVCGYGKEFGADNYCPNCGAKLDL